MRMSNGVPWSYFDRFEVSNYKDAGGYLPFEGDGDNRAEQCVTAVSRILYEWYNDGGVFDNNYTVKDHWNDASSFANWLAEYAPGADEILSRIQDIRDTDEYELRILKPLADLCYNVSYLKRLERLPKVDSVYSCSGPYYISETPNEDEDGWYDKKPLLKRGRSKSKFKPLVGLKFLQRKPSAKRSVSKDRKSGGNVDFTKSNRFGFPIYKIWESFGQYNVLARNPETGEWVYGRRYDMDSGIWAGGTYRLNIDDLYERCPPYGKLVVDNKRGNTGKY